MSINRFHDPEAQRLRVENMDAGHLDDLAFEDRIKDHTDGPLWSLPFSRQDWLEFRARCARMDREAA